MKFEHTTYQCNRLDRLRQGWTKHTPSDDTPTTSNPKKFLNQEFQCHVVASKILVNSTLYLNKFREHLRQNRSLTLSTSQRCHSFRVYHKTCLTISILCLGSSEFTILTITQGCDLVCQCRGSKDVSKRKSSIQKSVPVRENVRVQVI